MLFRSNGTVTELNGEARRSTNDIIRDYVGTYDDFILTVLSIQNNKVGSFVDMGQTERKDLLAQFMGLTVFDSLYNLSSEKTKEINTLLKNFKNNDYTQKLIDLNSNIENFSGSLKITNEKLDSLNEQRDIENNNLLEETKKLINVDGNLTDINSLETKKIQTEKEINETSSSLELYKNELNQLEPKYKNYVSIIDGYVDIETKYSSYTETCDLVKEKELLIEKKKLVVNSKLQKLKKLEEHKYDPNCSFCTNNIFVKDAIKTREELESDKVEAKNLITEYTNIKNKSILLANVEVDYKKYTDTKKLLKIGRAHV